MIWNGSCHVPGQTSSISISMKCDEIAAHLLLVLLVEPETVQLEVSCGRFLIPAPLWPRVNRKSDPESRSFLASKSG